MPGTFSHPLAVVPIHRFFPARSSFVALVIGSMSPDFAYYIRQFPLARAAHTVPGTFFICLPTSLLVLSIFYLLRPSLCFMLPEPHRAALMPLARVHPRLCLRNFSIAAGSVLLGAWTHTVWDSFTHEQGWTVRHVPILRAPLIHLGGTSLSTFYILQQLSTFGAGASLIAMYLRWLYRRSAPSRPTSNLSTDGWRYLLIGLLAVISLGSAIPAALRMASLFDGYTAFRVFMFRVGVYATAVFVPSVTFASTLLYALHRRRN